MEFLTLLSGPHFELIFALPFPTLRPSSLTGKVVGGAGVRFLWQQ
jgi:hypothetical protein